MRITKNVLRTLIELDEDSDISESKARNNENSSDSVSDNSISSPNN